MFARTHTPRLVATLEVLNGRGRTVLFYPGPATADPVGAQQ
jgi:hypothetical protein